MRKLLFLSVLLASPAYADSPACTQLLEEAKVQSAILRAPAAIGGVDSTSSSQQDAIAGVSYSFSDRSRANHIDASAREQCLVNQYTDDLTVWLKYNSLHLSQLSAKTENDYIQQNWSVITAQRTKLKQLLDAHQITVGDYEALMVQIDSLHTKMTANTVYLAQPNRMDPALDVPAAIDAIKTHSRALENSVNQSRMTQGWDLQLRAGARVPVIDRSRMASHSPQAFGAFTARYSFGLGSAREAARSAEAQIDETLLSDTTGPIVGVYDLMAAYKTEMLDIEQTQLPQLHERITEYQTLLGKISDIDSVKATVTAAEASAKLVQLQAVEAGLRAKLAWMKKTTTAIPVRD